MTRLCPPIKLAAGAALLLGSVAVAFGADFHELFSRGGPAAKSSSKRHPHEFRIRGNLRRPLAPGVSEPLNLRLTNPHRFDLKVTRLTVAVEVDARHAAAGCWAAGNFEVKGLARWAYPIRLRRRRTRTLRALGIKRLPRVAMRNLAVNQDACRGARLGFRYAGRARRWRGARAR